MSYRSRTGGSTAGNVVAFSTSPTAAEAVSRGRPQPSLSEGERRHRQADHHNALEKYTNHTRESDGGGVSRGVVVDEDDEYDTRNNSRNLAGSSNSFSSTSNAHRRDGNGSTNHSQHYPPASSNESTLNGRTRLERSASALAAAFTQNLQQVTRSGSESALDGTPTTAGLPAAFLDADSFKAALSAWCQRMQLQDQPREFMGATLLPEVTVVDFEDGTYIGTVDVEGQPAGYGRAVWDSEDQYEGEWLHSVMHGKGFYRWRDGDYYKGDYVDGFMNGFGELKDETGLYIGEWVDDARQGLGHMEYTGGNVYDGEWLCNMRHGHGKLVTKEGQVYEGEYVQNMREGKGVLRNPDGSLYDGDFVDDKPNGRGTFLWPDGAKYIGSFKDGLRHGEGCEWLPDGSWMAGTYIDGECDENQVVRHKPIASDFQEPELPDDVATVLEPLDPRQLIKLTQAAAAAERRVGRGGSSSTTTPSTPSAAAGANGSTLRNRRTSGGVPSTPKSPAPSVSVDKSQVSEEMASAAASTGDSAVHRADRGAMNATANSAASDAPGSPFALALRPTQLTDKDLENWTQLKIIGKGSFGAVYEALLVTGRTVCCKVIELGNVESNEELDKLKNEIALMKRMHHPNIVQYYGSTEDKDKNTMNIFMELVSGGSLNSFVKKFKTIPMKTMQQWVFQMVCGVKYLHDCGIVHRDIKGDNVLVSLDGIVKLADFGCSKSIDDACSATHGCATMVGTPYWMAPEVIKCEAGGYGAKSDIWSIGCTIVEMITGKPPWPECNSMWAAVYKIANSTGLPTEIPTDLEPQLMNLLERCFERDPRKRASAKDLLEHPFLAEVADAAMTSSQ